MTLMQTMAGALVQLFESIKGYLLGVESYTNPTLTEVMQGLVINILSETTITLTKPLRGSVWMV